MYVCVLGTYTQPHSTQLGMISVEKRAFIGPRCLRCSFTLCSTQRAWGAQLLQQKQVDIASFRMQMQHGRDGRTYIPTLSKETERRRKASQSRKIPQTAFPEVYSILKAHFSGFLIKVHLPRSQQRMRRGGVLRNTGFRAVNCQGKAQLRRLLRN